jgi:hypothetical protein
MCTVSVIATPGGFRLACNRDELRTRPPALPPKVARFGERLAVFPLDAAGGGTWVATSDAGIAFALLNVNVNGAAAAPAGRTSRGLVIPTLLGCDGLEAATSRALKLNCRNFSPFRLVMADARGCAAFSWDGRDRGLQLSRLARPLLFTSSGLGDALVGPPRRRLFEETVWVRPTPTAQDAFHRHRWPDRPHLSVHMSRPDARTVSHTVIDVAPERVRLAYRGAAPGDDGPVGAIELELPSPVHA